MALNAQQSATLDVRLKSDILTFVLSRKRFEIGGSKVILF